MKLVLQRLKSTESCTHGDLFIDGVWHCFTLEDVVREEKIYGKTAIPAGTYRVIINYSNRFKRELPLLINVPNFEGVRIHMGNSSKDTSGCVLVGAERPNEDRDWIGRSLIAFKPLFSKMKDALNAGEKIELIILNEEKS